MIDKVIFKEVTLLGVFTHEITGVIPAIKFAESRKYPFEKLVTQRFPLYRSETALKVNIRKIKKENPIKVVISAVVFINNGLYCGSVLNNISSCSFLR